ncbi:hypothetical protein IV102_11260 [bacterium]|nr:hypothetical protein [bacterium]
MSRSSAHRALIGGGWEGARQARQAAMAKRLAAGPPSTLRPLMVQLYVTRYRSSVRQWPQVARLLEQVNEIFGPAQIVFQLTEPAECNRSVSYANRCPFGADIDHEFEWLHLAMVPKLPDDLPVLPACGRCALISDKCSDRNVAQALGSLLGLLSSPEGLMSDGPGLELTRTEVQWARWQAWLLQGQPVPLPLVTLPVWVYPVITPAARHSQRSHAEVQELLERTNLVWQQAGLAFELAEWCALHEHDLGEEQWVQALQPDGQPLEALNQLNSRALHLFVVKEPAATWKVFPDENRRSLLIRDDLWRENLPERNLGHALGSLLGLPAVVGTDQLMCPYSQGTRLSATEAARARARGLEITGCQPDCGPDQLARLAIEEATDPPKAGLDPLPMTVHLLLVREARLASQQSLEEATLWLERVNRIWSQAAITVNATLAEVSVSDSTLEAVFPNPAGSTSTRKPSCAGLQKCAGYDPGVLNLFVLHQLPIAGREGQFQSYTSWPGARVVVLAESVAWHSPDKQLALALAVGLGLKASPKGPLTLLLSSRTPGLRFTSEHIAAARAGLSLTRTAPAVAPDVSVSTLSVPVQIFGAQAEILEAANLFWARAGIRWTCQGTAPLPEELDTTSSQSLLAVCGFQAGTVNLFWRSGQPGQSFREYRMLVCGQELPRALADFLNLKLSGAALTSQEISRARAQLANLKEVLETVPEAGQLIPLTLPLRLFVVRNSRHGSSLSPEQVQLMAAGAAEIFKQAGIVVQLKGCQECSLSEAAIEAALPNESGDLQRRRSFVAMTGAAGYELGAVNLFVLRQVVSVGGSQGLLSTHDKPTRVVLMRDHDSTFSPAKLLARTLATLLELPYNDFSRPDTLRGSSTGTQLTATEVAKARDQLSRLFPTLMVIPRLSFQAWPNP